MGQLDHEFRSDVHSTVLPLKNRQWTILYVWWVYVVVCVGVG